MTPGTWNALSTPNHMWKDGKLRIYSVSDLHTDHKSNFRRIEEWEKELNLKQDSTNILIVAGDISANLDILRKTLQILKKLFNYVIFIPGNNEVS